MKSKCDNWGIAKSRFMKEQETKVLLSSLGLKHHWIKFHSQVIFCFDCIKMNEIVNKFLLAGDKFIPNIHLKQPGFTYSAYGPFT